MANIFGGRPSYYQESPRQPPADDRGRYTDRSTNNYESPRQSQHEYEPITYRSGRPDMGFPRSDINVPYPQEPFRRRRNEYEQPPDIGYGIKFDPYAEKEQPKPHPGWMLLLRFNRNGLTNVQRALTMCAKHIDADAGKILGIARPYNVQIHEGGDAWTTFGRARQMGSGSNQTTHYETDYCVLAIYYPSLTRAIQWFDRDSCFKQKDFPAPHTTDCIALPLNVNIDPTTSNTIVLTEYPKIVHPEYFRDKFSIPTEDMMKRRYRASPYIVKATSIPVDDPRQRVARHLRGCWIRRNSIITASTFDSIKEAHRYFTDPDYFRCKEAQDRVSAPTTVVMELEDWRL